MATKRKRPVKRETTFYETLTLPVGRSLSPSALAEDSKTLSKVLTVALAAVIILVVAFTSRSIGLVNTANVTPAGSIVISGASASDAVLQSTQSVESFQSARNDVQVQNGSSLQAFSDAANLQGGIPAQ